MKKTNMQRLGIVLATIAAAMTLQMVASPAASASSCAHVIGHVQCNPSEIS